MASGIYHCLVWCIHCEHAVVTTSPWVVFEHWSVDLASLCFATHSAVEEQSWLSRQSVNIFFIHRLLHRVTEITLILINWRFLRGHDETQKHFFSLIYGRKWGNFVWYLAIWRENICVDRDLWIRALSLRKNERFRENIFSKNAYVEFPMQIFSDRIFLRLCLNSIVRNGNVRIYGRMLNFRWMHSMTARQLLCNVCLNVYSQLTYNHVFLGASAIYIYFYAVWARNRLARTMQPSLDSPVQWGPCSDLAQVKHKLPVCYNKWTFCLVCSKEECPMQWS